MDHNCKRDETIGILKKGVENLERWQESQNGSIGRVEGKIDKLISWGMKTAVVISLGLVGNIIILLLGRK